MINARRLLSVLFAATAAAVASSEPAPTRTLAAETVTKITAPFTVAAVGDVIMPQPVERGDPGFRALIDVIRAADVGFGNMESGLVDFRTFPGPVAGTLAPLETGEAIKAMGITMMARANNHALDGGVAGMVSTDEALDRLGITHAGTGPMLQEARAPRFRETAKGRVALVSMFSIEDSGNFGPAYTRTEATPRNGLIGGGAGVNPLHLTTYNILRPEQLDQLKRIAGATYGERRGASLPAANGAPERFRFFDQWYQAGNDAGALHYEMNEGDRRAILDSIRSGKVQADFLIATIHSHQATRFCGACAFGTVQGMKEATDHYPPDYLVELAHASIDGGADMFVTHGVHTLAGIEIYKGKPIFYGLSNFVFQFGLQWGAGYDAMENYRKRAELDNPESQQAVLTTSRFEQGRLAEVRLYPIDLGGTRRPISRMGIPMTPAPAEAQRILRALQDYSRPFGTAIAIEGDVGVIRLSRNEPG